MNLQSFLPLAQRLFTRPGVTYGYDAIISGTPVCGKAALQKAVGRNTFRGFYRKAGFTRGASAVFDPFFLENKARILSQLRSISTRSEMDAFGHTLSEEVRAKLTNVEERQLTSYNKVRKPVDLYLEHIVAMASELSDEERLRLAPALFLPLDSWIFGAPELFSERELAHYGLSRRSTYKDVKERPLYQSLHRLTEEKAAAVSSDFCPIYFDLLWSERHLRTNSRSLFESNP